MSSVPEKSNLVSEKRSFFIRSGSFEKLKCSAKYPFRLVGIKLSKASTAELAESIISRSRLLSQRLLLVLFIIVYKAICAALSIILIRTSTNPLTVVAVCDKIEKNNSLGFYERLQIKVENLQKHKKRLESYKNCDIIYNQQSSGPVTTTIQKPIISQQPSPLSTESSSIKFIPKNFNEKNLIKNEDINELKVEAKKLREKEIKKLKKGNLNTKRNLIEAICLYPLVYGSILIMLCQIYILGNIINTIPITFGYIFLNGSLAFIAFITFKVFLIHKIPKNESNQPKNKKQNSSSNNQNSSESQSNCSESKRQSRTRLKRDIDLSNKTLSKIKLL